jgi:phosphoserine phosphatase
MRAQPPFGAVYFDCDSTLSTIEGVDELVAGLDRRTQQELLLLTQRAMEGSLPLGAVYETRLAQIAPNRSALVGVGTRYVDRVVEDAGNVVAALQYLGKHVGIVSGGLLLPVRMLAQTLGIDPANVYAVPLHFHDDGSYRDFDRQCPLWQNGGKIDVLRALPASHRPLVFVGDGVTDLETQGTAADLFVGFGGVVVRQKVKATAQAWIESPSLASLLPLVLTGEELARLADDPRFHLLVHRATATT